MKKIILASALLAATAFSASAEGSKSFNGFYLGAQAGFAKHTTKLDNAHVIFNKLEDIDAVYPNKTKKSNGFLVGTYFGYGQNLNGFYLGAEMSILADSAKKSVTISGGNSDADLVGTITSKYKRGLVFGFAPRMGVVFGENLVYVKPGIEISRDKVSVDGSQVATRTTREDVIDDAGAITSVATANNTAYTGSKSSKQKIEMAFAPAFGYERAFGNVLVRAEYTYNLGKKIKTGYSQTSYKSHRFVIGAAYKF
ncbi:MAG: outer membrane beta-barrel protein [Candidatus Paracaedibacteraceae bacterium]|nr:outer membrane beta-barrel protein [Candidatus Paracaedibacteraceae bacterium]